MPRVFDCFLFFNELDLLEIRLNELAHIVDVFVIAEARETFTGKQKPLIFGENRSRLSAFANKIRHVIVDKTEPSLGSWPRQHFQRNALERGISDALPTDLIMLSDVDEIPRGDVVEEFRRRPPSASDVACLELRMFNYFLNLESPNRWLRSGPRIVQKQSLGGMQSLRNVRGPTGGLLKDGMRALSACIEMGRLTRRILVPNAGWHFSYVGGLDAIAEKVGAVSGAKNLPKDFYNRALLANRVREGIGSSEGDTQFDKRKIDETFPKHVRENMARFHDLIADV